MKRDEEKKDYPEGQMSVKQHKLLGYERAADRVGSG